MGKRNFDYMKDISSLHGLYALCNEAEVWQVADPDKSALAGRMALEHVVSLIYFLKHLEKPEHASLFQLVDDESFKHFIHSDDLMRRLHYIRKVGNQAAHNGGTSKKESFFSLLNLYDFVGCVLMEIGAIDCYPRFDKTLLSPEVGLYVAPKESEIHADAKESKALIETKENFEIKTEQLPLVPDPKDITEAETRQLYIDRSALQEEQFEDVEWLDTFGDKVVRIGDFVNILHSAIEKGTIRCSELGSDSHPYVLDEKAISVDMAAEDRKLS